MNSDQNLMRQEYRPLSVAEAAQMKAIKDAGIAFVTMIDDMKRPENLSVVSRSGAREFALAKTKIEEAVMWAVKGITG